MPVIFEFREGNEYLSSHTGLSLVGALLAKTNLKDLVDKIELFDCREPKISHSDVLYAMVGLLCLGKPNYDAIEIFREDPFFIQSLGIGECPSSSTLRQRLDAIGDAFDSVIKEESSQLVGGIAPCVSSISTSCGSFVPLDADVSPFDNSKTNKEGVSRTYKGYDGFAPIFAYLGREGYLVNVELREGKQHCQSDTPEFLRESIRYSKKVTNAKILVRLDAGNDSIDNIKVFMEQHVEWIIKRNLRRESKEKWFQTAKEFGIKRRLRHGKTVWRGVTYRYAPKLKEKLRIVFEVTERTQTADGQVLLIPDIDVDTYYTSLDFSPEETIDVLYHDHATCEQFHSEIKSDMDLERLPSKYFDTNGVMLLIGMLSYNILRLCGQESLREDNGTIHQRPQYRKEAGRRRIRTLMQDLIYIASNITHHSRIWYLSFGRYCVWNKVWQHIYKSFMQQIITNNICGALSMGP